VDAHRNEGIVRRLVDAIQPSLDMLFSFDEQPYGGPFKDARM